ncbi:hypothetical protein [Tenacibaculum sp. 190524A05c]|uniref:hypothetical protein n=1 Tax=Tenacibaculum platacis TaxID=3137852 RepID=UPI0031FB6A57
MAKQDQKKEQTGLTDEQKKAIQVLFNVADLSVGNGVFKNTNEVVVVHGAKAVLNELIE